MTLALQLTMACVFIQVGLTFVTALKMAKARIGAHQFTDLTMKDIAVNNDAYPDAARKVANNLNNQFEFPILFYVAIAFAAILEATTLPLAIFAIGFVVARIAHHVIHTGSNHVRKRFIAFLASLVMVFSMWVALGLTLVGVL